jgi:hypothetical protein
LKGTFHTIRHLFSPIHERKKRSIGSDPEAEMAQVFSKLPKNQNAISAALHRFVRKDSTMGSYPIRSSQTPAVRWIGRVNIDTIRFNLDLQALVRILSNRIADKQHIVT